MYVCSLDDEPTWRTAMLVQFGRDPDGPRANLTYLGGPLVALDGIIPTLRSRSMYIHVCLVHVCELVCMYGSMNMYVFQMDMQSMPWKGPTLC